jgi:hypothetical protein
LKTRRQQLPDDRRGSFGVVLVFRFARNNRCRDKSILARR